MMNERIRQLAKQAGYDVKPFYKGEDGYQTPHYKDEKLEKFAELIVRECMNAVCDPRTTYSESMTESSAMYTARERIRKHFGG
jgi:hypothetical protein